MNALPATLHAQLVAFENARRAIAEARSFDDLLTIRDQVDAVRIWAKMAKERSLEIDCAEMRLLAERRIGLAIGDARDAGALAQGAAAKGWKTLDAPTLAEAGVDKNLAHRARQLAALAEDDFVARLTRRRHDIEAGRKRVTVDLFEDDKAAKRAEREAALAAVQCALPAKVYGVIYDDPEWRHEVYSRETGLDRGAENHYPTSTVAEIFARDLEMIGAIAAKDCAWFRWTTNQHLAHALRSIEILGFTYRSSWIWDKRRIGKGHWNRNRHEQLLLAVRGDVPCPAPGTQFDSLIEAKPGRHSEKPEIFVQMIEAYFPNLPKIELNRRGAPRPGWDAWGNEVEGAPEAPKVPLPTTCEDLAERLVEAGFAPNTYLLGLNGIGCSFDEYPWSLPSRAFRFVLDFVQANADGPDRIELKHSAFAEHPIVAEIETTIGISPVLVDDDRDLPCWWHATDLMTEAHWRDLLDTRRFTTDEALFRAVCFALQSPREYDAAGKKEGKISIATARAVLAELGAAEPSVDQSRALLLDKQVLMGGELTDDGNGKERKTPSYPMNLIRTDLAAAWLVVHGIEQGWFERVRSGYLEISAKGRGLRGESHQLQAAE